MKKLIALLLCLIMVVSVFAGCGKKETKKQSDGTLTIGLPKSSLVTDYYNNYYTQWLQEKTGLKLEFQFFAAAAHHGGRQAAAARHPVWLWLGR